jgi:hypothetical protein
MRRRLPPALLAALSLACGSASAATQLDRLVERGPPTVVVGTLFVLGSPPAMLAGALRGRSVRLPACRFGHGMKMVAVGAVALPFGLLVSPFHLGRLPDAWMDAVVDAVQEDYCARPPGAVFP